MKLRLSLAIILGFIAFISCESEISLSVKIDRTSQNFGNIETNSSGATDFTIDNKTKGEITIVSVTFESTNVDWAAQFEVVSGATAPNNKIAKKSTHKITIRFNAAGGYCDAVMKIKYSDSKGRQKLFEVKLKGFGLPRIVTTSPIAFGIENVTYSFTFDALGGTPGYTWGFSNWTFNSASVPSGPTGLTFSSTGLISGLPKSVDIGAWTFDVILSDSTIPTPFTKTGNFTFNIISAAGVMKIKAVSAVPTSVQQGGKNYAVEMQVENNIPEPINIDLFGLIFTRSGSDVTDQYYFAFDSLNPASLPASSTTTLNFKVKVKHSAQLGTATIDGYFYGSTAYNKFSDTSADSVDTWTVSVGTPSLQTIYRETFESSNHDWSFQTTSAIDWQWGSPQGLGGTGSGGYGAADPTADHTTGTAQGKVIGTDLSNDGNYDITSSHPYEYAISPVINTLGVTNITLKFWRWLNCLYPPYAQPQVEVFNGVSWQVVWNVSGYTWTAESNWSQQSIDISAHANAYMRIRFSMSIGTALSSYYNQSGWNVDDVEISGYRTTRAEWGDETDVKIGANNVPLTGANVSSFKQDLYILGYKGTSSLSSQILKFNTLTNLWTNTGLNISSARAFGFAVLLDGKIYIIGGEEASGSVSTVDIFDPIANTISAGPSLNTPRSYHAAAIVNEVIYVFGGKNAAGSPIDTVEKLDINNPGSPWVNVTATLHEVKYGLAAVAYNDGMIYIFGGANASFNRNLIFKFNPTTETFTSITTTLRSTKAGLFGIYMNGKIYLIGGVISGSTSIYQVDEYYPPTDTISEGSDYPITISWAAAAVIGNKIYVPGGWGTSATNKHFSFNAE